MFTGKGEPATHAVTDGDELVFDLETIRRLGSIAAIEAHAAEADFTPPALIISPVEAAEAGHG